MPEAEKVTPVSTEEGLVKVAMPAPLTGSQSGESEAGTGRASSLTVASRFHGPLPVSTAPASTSGPEFVGRKKPRLSKTAVDGVAATALVMARPTSGEAPIVATVCVVPRWLHTTPSALYQAEKASPARTSRTQRGMVYWVVPAVS